MRCGPNSLIYNFRWHLRVWGPSDDSPETHTRFGIIPILPRGASAPLPRAGVVRWFSRCVYRNSQSVPTNEGSDSINKKKRQIIVCYYQTWYVDIVISAFTLSFTRGKSIHVRVHVYFKMKFYFLNYHCCHL